MAAEIEPEANRFDHLFDSIGRLTDAMDQEGGQWSYSRSAFANGDIRAEVFTAEGEVTSYVDRTDSLGVYTSTITDPAGGVTLFSESADGLSVDKSLPCGMELSFKYGIDSRYRFKYVEEMIERMPSGLSKATKRAKTYQDTDADGGPDLITETVRVNGKATTLVTDTLQATKTLTSPAGRSVTTDYDPTNLLVTRLSIPGLFDTTCGYDLRGRLTSITTGTRQSRFAYDSRGNLASITDPESQTTCYSYDAVGRMTGIDRPDGSSVGFAYDRNGNMTVLTNPASIDHGFGYNTVNLNSSYNTPLSGSCSYVYDRDRRLTRVNFPSGKQITNVYQGGVIQEIQTPEGYIDLTYVCGSKVASITKGVEEVSYGYDGPLVTGENLSGTLDESLTYRYNNDFNLSSFTYGGGTESYTYDNDGLLTGAGRFTIVRDAGNGLPTSVTGGALSLGRTFNGYGELEAQDFTVGGQGVTSWSLGRDKAGRITNKTETVDGVTANYVYTYDPMGRLLTVTKDGTLVEEYQYDSVGTRTYEMNTQRGIAGRTFTYDEEDHLLTAGGDVYQYDADGYLQSKSTGSGDTTYTYSSRGELLSVALPDSTLIEYVHDPLGRRVAKKIDGTIVAEYLWQGLVRLLAVYDGAGSMTMRFEYADGRMPVRMITGEGTYYPAYDQVGSLRLVSDASGSVVKRIDYDTFGNIIGDTAPSFKVPFGFAGGLHDRDTGLVRFGSRDYDPDVGRWTAKDPILFAGGSVDLYGYCLNDPVNLVDPLGLIVEANPFSILDVYFPKITISSGFVIGGMEHYVNYSNPEQRRYNVTTPQLAGGFNINFHLNPCSAQERPLTITLGLSTYFGLNVTSDLSTISLGIGVGISAYPGVNVAYPID
jgi:RHS repeat-associated protein